MTATTGAYRAAYEASASHPEQFWIDAAKAVDWVTPPTSALDNSGAPVYRWFPGAELNTCFNAVDRHVLAGRGDQTAVIYDSAMTGVKDRFTYGELLEEVRAFAGGHVQRRKFTTKHIRTDKNAPGKPGAFLH